MVDSESKFKILVVDDDNFNLKVLCDILSDLYAIHIAKSGNEALEQAVSIFPDLILLDIIMPDINGFDVLKKLKTLPTVRNIPVICITGLNDVENEEKGFFLGAVDYITKPYHNTIVKARVRTQLKIVNQMRAIEKLGLLDPLTDMPNRRHYDRHLREEWQRAARSGSPISIISIDIDDFKKYNTTYGNPQGDVLLTVYAKILVTSVNRPRSLAARIGGEEFSIILPDMNLQESFIVAEKIREKIESSMVPSISGNTMTRATVSAGVASTVPANEYSFYDLLTDSDKALYAAKKSGKNKVCSIPS